MTPTSIPLADIRPSKTNPRKSYDAAKLAELTASIKTHGVLQPVLVRQNGKGYELVAGERRYRAAKAAGLDALPVTVRELTDVQVLEIQVVENLQRDDLHPLEEAEGYRQLHETHGYAVEDLAAKVGKSKAYVYARLKLCTLPAPAKKAFLEGKLSPSAALLVARIPDPKLAAAAVLLIVPPQYRGENEEVLEVVPKAAAMKILHEKYPSSMRSTGDSSHKQEVARLRRHRLLQQAGALAVEAIVGKAAAAKPDIAFWRWLTIAMLHSVRSAAYEVEKRRGITGAGQHRAAGHGAAGLEKAVPAMKEPDLRALVVELLATEGIPSYAGASLRAPLTTACTLYGVSLAAAQTRARQLAAAKPKKKGRAAPAGGEKACRECGCTYTTPCAGGCAWVPKAKPPLCTSCA